VGENEFSTSLDPDSSGVSVFICNRGPVAQLGARFHGMEEVVGSIPTRSTKILRFPIHGVVSTSLGCFVFRLIKMAKEQS
jgi:hypothetical protein